MARRSKAPVAIVTGAARGIGRAIARHLLEGGWHVGAVDLPRSGLQRSYGRHGRNGVLIEGDVADEGTARCTVEVITDKFNRLDALVSNAGIMLRKPLRQLTLAEWRKVTICSIPSAGSAGPKTLPRWSHSCSMANARALSPGRISSWMA